MMISPGITWTIHGTNGNLAYRTNNPHTPVYGSGQYTTIFGFIDTIAFEEFRYAVIQKAGMLHCKYTEINGTLQASVVPLANWSLTVIDFSSKSNPVGDAKLWRDVDSETPCDMNPLLYFSFPYWRLMLTALFGINITIIVWQATTVRYWLLVGLSVSIVNEWEMWKRFPLFIPYRI